MTNACRVGNGISVAGFSVKASPVYSNINMFVLQSLVRMQATLTIVGISARVSSWLIAYGTKW